MLGIEGDEGGHEGRRLLDLQAGVLARALHVQRLRRQGDLAFAAAQLLQAHVGVRGDGEDQRVDRRLAGEVLGVGGVAHHRVLLEALEHERAAADRLGVELFRGSGLHQLVGVFRRIDGGEAHAQHRQEGRVGVVENEQHLVVAAFLHPLDQLRQLHRLGVREAVLRHLVPGIGRIEHALEAEHHVVGVERTARLEVGGAVEVHTLAQVEAIAQAVVGHRPALGQRGHHRPLAGVELDQAIHQHIGRGVGGGQRVVLDHVEALGAGFGAHAQGGSGGGLGEQQGARNREKAARRMTGSIRTVNMPIRSG